MQKKIKVVLLCHFSNEQIRNKIPLSKMKVRSFIQKLMGRELFEYTDFAIWNNVLFRELEHFAAEVRVHVISPHSGLKKKLVEFSVNGISYHIFKSEDDNLLSLAQNKVFGYTGRDWYGLNRKVVNKLILEINPDLVNLIGAENPYYSITALDIENIPVYLTCQTVYTNPDRKALRGEVNEVRWHTELMLHRKICYFGCTGRMHRDLVLKNNPNAIIFKHTFPLELPNEIKKVKKVYDFVFYSVMLSKKKGIIDAIEALGKVKQIKPEVNLLVVGGCTNEMKKYLDALVAKFNLSGNIYFHGPFQRHVDMYQFIVQAKYALLPIKIDVVSSTIIESMALGIPVVTYKTSGTPYLNKDKQCVLISNVADTQGLADNMLRLVNNKDFAHTIALNAKEFIEQYYDNTKNVKRLIADYQAIIEHYKYNTPIPEELLFDINEFPVYDKK
jgi:glycosyltransferase involved in cell wall biosynthesis